MLRRWLAVTAGVVALGLSGAVFVGCGGDDDGQSTLEEGGRVLTVTTSSDSLVFTPSTLRTKVGEPVKVVLDNSQATVLHDFTIDKIAVSNMHVEGSAEHMMGDGHSGMSTGTGDMGTGGSDVHMAAEKGMMASAEFTPDEAGEYVFYCTVEGHRQAGMEGTLFIE